METRCCVVIVAAPLAAFLTVATVMLLNPNVPTDGYMVVSPIDATYMICLTKCIITMSYIVDGTEFVSQRCSSCNLTTRNVTIYHSFIDHNDWKFERFGSITIAIVLYVCTFVWVLIVILISYFVNTIQANPQTVPINVVRAMPSMPSMPSTPIPIHIQPEMVVAENIDGIMSQLVVGKFNNDESNVLIVNP
jgi:hypothetical protein